MAYRNNKITAWSISRLHKYEECPFAAKCEFILRIKSEETDAMRRGTRIHDLAKDYILGTIDGSFSDDLKELSYAEPMLVEMRERFEDEPGSMEVENTWAYRRDWSETEWNDWNGCFLRVKLDVGLHDGDTFRVMDWKTGKYSKFKNDKYIDQIKLYGLSALKRYPEIKQAQGELVYLDAETVFGDDMIIKRREAKAIQADFEKRVGVMTNDDTFAPRPGRYCSWCQHSKANGGLCPL